ncbi:MAG: hypothetical protein OEV78_06180 [Spirochaetia bacterium]|nr:hypothetical protein [Spirochaetia bacterium]
MRKLDLEFDISDAALMALEKGFKLYDIKLVHGKSGLKVRVLLDKLDDPWGTPTVSDCGKFAKALDSRLTNLVNMGKMSDDYTLEVSSPGAERELVGSDEWVRFKDKPMKVRYNISPVKANANIFSLVRLDGETVYWKKAVLKKDKKSKNEKFNEEIGILIKDIIQVKLYLDF